MKIVSLAIVLMTAIVFGAGCETVKGAKKDITNAGGHIFRFVNAVDAQLQEKAW